ncbi:hypothetical protein JW998_05780 [candidate division KSB1 bacterium]|nr:hypothetical protein [candidate division KSB1 bacterium]
MNETQKTLIVVGLLLFLLVIAHHLIFIDRLKNDLLQAEYEILEETSDFLLEVDERVGMDEIAALERRFDIHLTLRFLILFAGFAAFITSCFFRDKSKESTVDDEWGDDEWEDDGA